ncbi:hypothetical protein GFJ25_21200 [Escherichia coli]|nr:hypothetical protein [Escherichia coli]
MTFTGAPADQFGDSNQAFGYMAILQTIYFIHINEPKISIKPLATVIWLFWGTKQRCSIN